MEVRLDGTGTKTDPEDALRGDLFRLNEVQLIFKKYQKLGFGVEIEHVATHIFRKAFALDIAERYGVATAQAALGHKNLATAQK